MKNTKSNLSSVLVILLAVVILLGIGCGTYYLFFNKKVAENSSSETELSPTENNSDEEDQTPEIRTYFITYRAAGANTSLSLFEKGSEYGLSKLSDGVYPESYEAGQTIVISNLKSTFECSGPKGDYHSGAGNGKASYGFYGWYLDNEMTVPFSGTISSDTVGDIVLYAHIVSLSSHYY